MALDTSTAADYLRRSLQQQQLYAFWRAAGDLARARLAIDVANWYYQQLGWPYYVPADFPGYAPNPTSPDAAIAAAAALPVDAGGPAVQNAAGDSAGTGGVRDTAGRSVVANSRGAAGSSSTSSDLQNAAIGRLSSGYQNNGALAEYCASFPDDPICWTGGEGVDDGGGSGNEGGPTYISNPVTIIINQQGLTLADVASKISGALASAAAAIATAVDSALAAAIAGLQHALNAIGNELMTVWQTLARLAGHILNFLKGVLLDVLHGLVAGLKALGQLLKDVFTHVIVPALQALQKLRNYLIKIYERFLRPLLIVLQDLRKVLAILKVFHVGFATKLDNVLADIQSKLSTPLLYLLRYTNAIANYINLILDARLFLQKPLFLASLNAYKGSSLNLLINSMNPPPDPARIAALQATAVIPTPAQTSTNFDMFLRSGGGPISTSLSAPSAQFDAYLKQGVA